MIAKFRGGACNDQGNKEKGMGRVRNGGLRYLKGKKAKGEKEKERKEGKEDDQRDMKRRQE